MCSDGRKCDDKKDDQLPNWVFCFCSNRKYLKRFLHNSFRRLCSSDISAQSDCGGSSLLSHNIYQNTASIPSSSQSLLHNPYRHLVSSQQQQQHSLIGGLNLSASSSAASALTPPTTASSAPTQTITTLSNNLYNNNHLYQHQNSTTLSGSGHNSKHNSSSSSGASAAISNHHPTPIEGLTALSSTTLHLTNSLCGGSSNSLSAAELGMSHWLTDGGSNSGEFHMCAESQTIKITHVFCVSLSIVKTELKSPAAIVDVNGLPLGPSHLDSTLFCTTPVANLDATQSSNAYDHKQDYYNYYNRYCYATTFVSTG